MIDEFAKVHHGAKLGKNVVIGPFTIVHENVEIGDNVTIGSNCELGIKSSLGDGSPLKISNGSLIRSHSVFYESSSFGANLVTGHRVTVRECTIAGAGLQIGSLGDIQGHCVIGEHVKMHSNVHIGQGSKIGNFVWVYPYVVLTNDPHPPSDIQKGVTLEDYSVISTMSTIMPGVVIKEGTLVGAHSNVTRDTKQNDLVVGNPAKSVGENTLLVHKETKESAYPWRKHFHRGYPSDVINTWKAEFEV